MLIKIEVNLFSLKTSFQERTNDRAVMPWYFSCRDEKDAVIVLFIN